MAIICDHSQYFEYKHCYLLLFIHVHAVLFSQSLQKIYKLEVCYHGYVHGIVFSIKM